MESKITISGLTSLIDKCCYINNFETNKKRDINSLSYLIDRTLSQSDCIKLGIGIEKLLLDTILYKLYKY